MQLTVINSGSTGNGYVLSNGTEALVLECGVPRQECLAALGWRTSHVAGCLLTHEHGDHAKYLSDYIEMMPVYASQGTACALATKSGKRQISVLEPLKQVRIGGFAVRPIPAEHDAAEPFAYVIDHEEIGRLLFATDTSYLRYRIPNMTNIMIECNYSLPLLNENVDAGIIPASLRDRTMRSHMSLEHLLQMLASNDLTQVVRIVLIHLSARNSQIDEFCRNVIAETGKCTVVAQKGLKIEINKTPF